MSTILKLEHIYKSFPGVKALDDMQIELEKGEMHAVCGENGAGKTTFIRLICGLQKPTSGTYTLFGAKSTDKNILNSRKRIGAVVETPSIYTDMTAKNNLKQQYQILGLPSYDGIDELLHLVGLSHTGKKKVKNFSLGMRQRLGIAIALVGSPDFLILDEPSNGLDPQGVIEIRELILKLNREKQITILISSHNLDELSRVATHYGFIANGKMIKETTEKELQKECRKSIKVTVTDTEVLARVLDILNIEYEILSDKVANIYGEIPVSELSLKLAKDNCYITSMHEQEETLESYYINLVGGANHE